MFEYILNVNHKYTHNQINKNAVKKGFRGKAPFINLCKKNNISETTSSEFTLL